MDPISEKIARWIGEGKDARSAHWQGGLEKMLDLFSPVLARGRLVPVRDLESDDRAVFTEAVAAVDLSPGLLAAFLPPAVAGNITPPEAADELVRIDPDKPSYKILVARPGKDLRLLCAEISSHAARPGADIYQSGALLGTYDYQNQEACLAGLTPTLRIHLWEKGRWPQEDYRRYTLNWFEKVLALGRGTVPVDEGSSFLHSPTLIKSDRIDAVFSLIHDMLAQHFADADGPDAEAEAAIRDMADGYARTDRCHAFAEERVLELLNVLKDLEIVNFGDFTNREAEQFKDAFPAAVRRIARRLDQATA